MDKKYENEIEKTLNSLDGINTVKADPYFYTRLTSKMESNRVASMQWKWALVMASVVILINAFFISDYSVLDEVEVDTVETLAVEYSAEWPSFYDNEISYESE